MTQHNPAPRGPGFDPEPSALLLATLVVPPEIGAAIKQVKLQVKQLGYDDTNQSARYGFVSVDKFFAAIGPLMAEAGLFLALQEIDTEIFETESYDNQGNPKKVKWLRNKYHVFLCHETGAVMGPFHRTIVVLMTGPQSFGSAESYVQKRFLRMQFMIPTGDRDDADLQDQSAMGNGQPAPRVTKPAGAPAQQAVQQPAQTRAQPPRPAAQRQQPRPAQPAPQAALQTESENPAPAEVKFTSPQPIRGPGIEPQTTQEEAQEPAAPEDTAAMEEPEAPAAEPPKPTGPLPKNHPTYQAAIKEYNAINQKQAKAQSRKELTQIVLENDARLAEMAEIAPEVKAAVEKLRTAMQNRLNTLK